MYCRDIDSCFMEINAYCTGNNTGRTLLVNTENYSVYQDIKLKLEADVSKKCVYVSECCPDNELPDMEDILNQIADEKDYVLIGYSQASMLRSAEYLEMVLQKLLDLPVSGHTVVLLDHCEQYVKKLFGIHPDVQKRILMVEGEVSQMPRIRLATNLSECVGVESINGMKRLFIYFEKLTDVILKKNPEVTVVTKYSPALFKDALFSVSACESVYTLLKRRYLDIAGGTEKNYGTDEQWKYLAKLLEKYTTLSAVAKKIFGSTENLHFYLGQVNDEGSQNKQWLLWLCMKVFTQKSNKYLYEVMKNSKTYNDFEEHVFMDLLKIKVDSVDFRQCYAERRRLIDSMQENIEMIDEYCSKVGVYQKESIYYLTDLSEREELVFMQCLAKYDYSREELMEITETSYKSLNDYLKKFSFNVTNTKVPEGDDKLRDILTDYFEAYKIQKLSNRIYPEFLDKVNMYAEDRPYNRLQARTSIISKMDKNNAQLYFFDALGVEYLGFIQSRCEKYGLIAEIAIGHCVLPSITEKNKDFMHYFVGEMLDIKELDELKHHSQVVDYQQCKEPVHIFKELQIIDDELKKMQSKLKQGYCDKAVIVSDHGASRLAVIYEQENDKLELEEKGIHSGRCCPAESDPKIPHVSYADGFAVLANYERFKGGRKANVEVHGGATMEEVVIPVITLTKKPTDIDICFVESTVILKGKDPASIVVYSNVPLLNPKLVVNEHVYEGEFLEDSKHVKFIMPEFKRTKDYTASFFDGDRELASNMEFHVQKNTQEQQLFKKNPF